MHVDLELGDHLNASAADGVGILRVGRVAQIEDQRYTVREFLDSGATGELYRVESAGQTWAMKIYVPAHNLLRSQQTLTEGLWSQIGTAVGYQTKEYQSLKDMNHPNIVRVHAAGLLRLNKAESASLRASGEHLPNLPALITEFIDGQPLDVALAAGLPSRATTDILCQIATALDYIHFERTYLHCDIKPGNILIREGSQAPVLVDFATSKNFNFDEVRKDDQTTLAVAPALIGAMPPLVTFFQNAMRGSLTRQELFEQCFPTIDLYQFGVMLRDLRPNIIPAFLDEHEEEYFDYLVGRLGTWTSADGMREEPIEPKFRRLGSHLFYPFGVPELVSPSAATKKLSIPTGDAIPLVGAAGRIVENRSFRRLMTINQLSLLPYVYPGADYKRFVHAVHTYELARRATAQLLMNPIFRDIFDESSIRQLLVVALVHDINHFPFLHIVQEARLPGLDNRTVTDIFCSGEATNESQHGEPSMFRLLEDVGLTSDRFLTLAYGKHYEQDGHVDQVINSLISSGADIDKISYLHLDSLFTGVTYGQGIDNATLLNSLTIGRPQGNRLHIAYDERGLQAVENVFMTRFWNFRSVYWHHSNRALMAMVLHAVRRLFEEKRRNITEYLTATKWEGDFGAVRWLDSQYREVFGQPSTLAGLVETRSALYKRLYTVRPNGKNSEDELLYRGVSEAVGADKGSFELELSLRQEIADRLGLRYQIPIDVHDILIDVPRRGGLNDPGDAYITSGNSVVPLESISEPIHRLRSNYEQLTQRVRFFIAPRIAAVITKSERSASRAAIGELLRASVSSITASRGGVS